MLGRSIPELLALDADQVGGAEGEQLKRSLADAAADLDDRVVGQTTSGNEADPGIGAPPDPADRNDRPARDRPNNSRR